MYTDDISVYDSICDEFVSEEEFSDRYPEGQATEEIQLVWVVDGQGHIGTIDDFLAVVDYAHTYEERIPSSHIIMGDGSIRTITLEEIETMIAQWSTII